MPLFTVAISLIGPAMRKERHSRAIHAASIIAGYSEDDVFNASIRRKSGT
jgi:hypothetical protein